MLWKPVWLEFRGSIILRYPGKRVLGSELLGFQLCSTEGARGRACGSRSSSGTGPALQFCWTRAGLGGILSMSILSMARCAVLGHAYVSAQMHTFP